MLYTLHTNDLFVKINSKGAEITSIRFNELEYIWQAKPEIWPRHAPVLFPIVGRLKNSSLPQHGFARDKEFKLLSQTQNKISLELVSDAETLRVFPFEFKLIISYTISNDTVVCAYEVVNISSKQNLLFSVGAHPGFKIPITEQEKFEDYKLRFNSNKEYQTTVLVDGLLSEAKTKLPLQNGELNFSTSLFDKDALVFENSQIDSIELVSSKSGRGVEIKCKDWPYFGIWSKKGCDEFVCLEPWYGITDDANSSGDLQTKKGIIALKPSETFECSFSIHVF